MAARSIARRNLWLPPANADVDTTNPLANGLICAVNVANRIDHVSGRGPTATSGGPVAADKFGPAGDYATASGYQTYNFVPPAQSDEITIALLHRATSTTNTIGACAVTTAAQAHIASMQYWQSPFSGPDGVINDALSVAGPAITLNKPVLSTFRYRSGVISERRDIYFDGTATAVTTTTPGVAALVAYGTSPLFVIANERTLGFTAPGYYTAGFLWSRLLSPAELHLVAAAPFQMLAPRGRRYWHLSTPTSFVTTTQTVYLSTSAADAGVTVGSGTLKKATSVLPGGSSTLANINTVTGNTAGVQFTDSTTAGTNGTAISWYSDQFTAVTISGPISWSMWTKESATAANAAAALKIERCAADGTPISTVCDVSTSQGAGEMPTTAASDSGTISSPASTTLADGDRFRFTVLIDDAVDQGGSGTMASGRNCQIWYGANSGQGLASIAFTETLTVYTAPATTPVNKDLDARWSVQAAVGKSSDQRWSVRAVAAKQLDARWSVATSVGKQTDLRWSVATKAGQQVDTRWTVRAAVGKQLDTRWTVAKTVGAQSDLRWSVRVAVGAQSDERWAVRAAVGKQADLQWAVRAPAGANSDIRWAVRSIVADQVDARWSVRTGLGAQTDLRWAVRTAVGASTDQRWVVRALAGGSSDQRWALRAIAGTQTDIRWAVRALAGRQADLRWSVAEMVGAQADLRWAVRVIVTGYGGGYTGTDYGGSLAVTLQWAVQATAGNQIDLQWAVTGVPGVVGQQLDLRWAARAAVGVTVEQQWSVAKLVHAGSDLRWTLRALAGANIDTRWAARALAASDRDLRWAANALAGSTVDLRWQVLSNTAVGTVGSSTDLRWAIRELASSTVDIRWQILAIAAVGASADLRWALRAAAGGSLDLRWQLAALHAIAAAARLVAVPAEVRHLTVPADPRRQALVADVDRFVTVPST